MDDATVLQLLDEYRLLATHHAEPNDGTAAWAPRVNKAADQMIRIARRIATEGPAATTLFATLLTSKEDHLRSWAAHHLLDFMEPSHRESTAALNVIEADASGSSAEAVSARLWLENWRSERQDE